MRQVCQEAQNLVLQPLHEVQRDIQKISGAAGRVQDPDGAESSVEAAQSVRSAVLIPRLDLPHRGCLDAVPLLQQRFHDRWGDKPLDEGTGREMCP